MKSILHIAIDVKILP